MAVRNNSDALDELVNGVDGVEGLQSRINKKAPLNSPALTGTPTAPTPAANDNSTKIATTAYVAQRIQNLINAAPAALDTLGEIATALKNNPNAIQEILTALGNKADKTAGTSSTLGLTKLYTGTGSNTDGTMTQKAITNAIPEAVTLASSTGTSTTQGMTQKAITDKLDTKLNQATWDEFFFKESSNRIALKGNILYLSTDPTIAIGYLNGIGNFFSNGVQYNFKSDGIYLGNKKITN